MSDIQALRDHLVAVQREEPLHARVYAEGVAFCPRCPSRRECKRASLRLAEAETAMLSAVAVRP